MKEAERLAQALEAAISPAQLHPEDDVAMIARWFLEDAAALLRSQAAEIEALRADAEQLRLSLTFIVDRDLTYFDGYVDRHQIGMGAIEQARRVLKSDAAIDAARKETP